MTPRRVRESNGVAPRIRMLTRPLMVLDVETTGLDPRQDCIVELAACILSPKDLSEEAYYNSRVRPVSPIRLAAQKVHGLTEEDLKDAPTIHQVIEEFNRIALPDTILCGHNVSFDVAFLRAAYEYTGDDFAFDYHTLDIWSIAFFLLEAQGVTLESYTLNSLCSLFGIKRDQKHGAGQDVLASAAILRHLYAVAQGADMEVLGQFSLFE